jgi:hypothetical protein
VVKTERAEAMAKRQTAVKTSEKTSEPPWVRASISFPPDLYATLAGIAKRKKVSLAWVVRDASEQYVADQKPRAGKHQA